MKMGRASGFAVKPAIILSVLLLAANAVLGVILVNESRAAMKTLIDERMLDIAKTAADMLDGDDLETLTKEDQGTEAYQRISDILAAFQDSIDLEYICCIRVRGNKGFVFSVAPTLAEPGIFGDPITYTDALHAAGLGTPSVDRGDDWGRFYTAYSPVFNSAGKVAGIVAVDFAAAWYEAQLARQTGAIIVGSLISTVVGFALIFAATGGMRREMKAITADIADVSRDVNELSRIIDPDHVQCADEPEPLNDLRYLSRRLHHALEGLRQYTRSLTAQANSMITALSPEYRSVYYIDLDRDEGVCCQPHTQIDKGLRQGERFSYSRIMRAYADDFITNEYRDSFLRFIDPDHVRRGLEQERIITFRYVISRNGKEAYEMVRMAGVRHPEDRDDCTVHAVGMGFTDVDTETRKTQAQSQALSDALSAAEGANRAKTAFLSNMSHEIRTPMNAIIGLARIALNDPTVSDSSRVYLEKIGTSADHLLSIINDILDMSRIEAGRMTLHQEAFSLSALLEQVNGMIGGQCRDKGLAWHRELIGKAEDYYIGDDRKLRQALINILGNAVKFTPRGGSVDFTAERTAHYAGKSVFRFTVRDTGVGMTEEFLPKLFDPFAQEDAAAKTEYGSIGLGMSITKSIVEMMNGELQVESKKNAGTCITLTVTLSDSEQPLSDEGSIDPKAQTKTGLRGRRLLLAEDMDINAEIIEMVLGRREMEADRAVNGRAAVELFAERPRGYYAAILMDMRMPEMDGIEAARAIRAMDREDAKTIPIIALTANAFDEDVQRSLQAGLNAHLTKPVDADQLFETLESLIEP